MSNYYEILGLSNTASDVEIKRAFRRLSLELHPDRCEGSEQNAKYKKVVEAYGILGDINKRQEYDKTHKENRLTSYKNSRDFHDSRDFHEFQHYKFQQQNATHNDINDYTRSYDEIKQNDENHNHNHNSNSNRSTILVKQNRPIHFEEKPQEILEDVKQSVTITLEEAYTGISVPLNIQRMINNTIEEALIYVDVPSGTDHGEIIIIENKGNIKGRFRSNIRVKVLIEHHPYLKRDKLNVIYNLDISLMEALCGFKKELTHLDGKMYMIGNEKGNIVQQNARRCIQGKGFQRGQNVGHLMIIFNIVMPKKLSNEQIDKIRSVLQPIHYE